MLTPLDRHKFRLGSKQRVRGFDSSRIHRQSARDRPSSEVPRHLHSFESTLEMQVPALKQRATILLILKSSFVFILKIFKIY
jgi:hypothetical protein